MNVVVLASGRGSNLNVLIQAQKAYAIVGVVSDQPAAGALKLAQINGIPTRVVERPSGMDSALWDLKLSDALEPFHPDLIVLAGFMRILGPQTLCRFAHRIINIHPSLLPAFAGKHGPRDALAAGVKISGCTVHMVDEGIDTGPILAQAAVPVHAGDTEMSLHVRIQEAEHKLLPYLVNQIAEGHIELGARPVIHEKATTAAANLLYSPPLDVR